MSYVRICVLHVILCYMPFLSGGTLVSWSGEPFGLSLKTMRKIAERVWRNETGGRPEHLVFWSPYEAFPSLGIGHNIWFPAGQIASYTEGFPILCAYLRKHGIALPQWLEESLPEGAPWKTRDEFYDDHHRRHELFTILMSTIDIQAKFLFEQFSKVVPKLIRAAPQSQRARIRSTITLMLSSPAGVYALVDYCNFKGDGLNPKETSNGNRWGLLSVLLDMPLHLTSENCVRAFTLAAAKRLILLVEGSAPEYNRLRWLQGWIKRVSSYTDFTL